MGWDWRGLTCRSVGSDAAGRPAATQVRARVRVRVRVWVRARVRVRGGRSACSHPGGGEVRLGQC